MKEKVDKACSYCHKIISFGSDTLRMIDDLDYCKKRFEIMQKEKKDKTIKLKHGCDTCTDRLNANGLCNSSCKEYPPVDVNVELKKAVSAKNRRMDNIEMEGMSCPNCVYEDTSSTEEPCSSCDKNGYMEPDRNDRYMERCCANCTHQQSTKPCSNCSDDLDKFALKVDKFSLNKEKPLNDDIKPRNEMIDKISSVCADIEKTLISKVKQLIR